MCVGTGSSGLVGLVKSTCPCLLLVSIDISSKN